MKKVYFKIVALVLFVLGPIGMAYAADLNLSAELESGNYATHGGVFRRAAVAAKYSGNKIESIEFKNTSGVAEFICDPRSSTNTLCNAVFNQRYYKFEIVDSKRFLFTWASTPNGGGFRYFYRKIEN